VGALGAAFATRLFALKWLKRVEGSRAVKVTELGRSHFKNELGVEVV